MNAKILFINFLFGFSLPVFAQNKYRIISPYLRAAFFNTNVYKTQIDFPLTLIADSKGQRTMGEKATVRTVGNSVRYKIVNSNDNGYTIIKVLPRARLAYNVKSVDPLQLEYEIFKVDNLSDYDIDASGFYYSVKTSDIIPLQRTNLFSKIIGTPLVQPIKLRPDRGVEGWTMSGEFTVSYVFGFRMRLSNDPFKNSYLTIVPYGIGVGAAKYFTKSSDSTTTEKKIHSL